MPLRPAEIAELALWLAHARFLELDGDTMASETSRARANRARAELEYLAGTAAEVQTAQAVAAHLRAAADRLEALLDGSEADLPAVAMAARVLREAAAGLREDWQGDGPAITGDYCACGVHELVDAVERWARDILADIVRPASDPDLRLTYSTVIDRAGIAYRPFRVNGETSILHNPRSVTLLLQPRRMAWQDLCHLVYVLHHEIICHGLQGALDPARRRANASPSCHWTEGWVDTVMFGLVLQAWQRTVPEAWLPVRGSEAVGELWRFHNARYGQPPEFEEPLMVKRRHAKRAYEQLVNLFRDNRLAANLEEAEREARRFTLLANTHHEADCNRLNRLGRDLAHALLSPSQDGLPARAADACYLFIHDRDLGRLEETARMFFTDA